MPVAVSRGRFQWSLRAVLIATMLAGCGFGFIGAMIQEARRQDENSRNSLHTTIEISTMDGAFKAYRERYGSYPPSDFTNLDDANSPQYHVLYQHLATAFPQCNVSAEIAAIKKLGGISPAQALYFWLNGFSADPRQPISKLLSNPGGNVPFYSFDPSRLRYPAGKKACPVYLSLCGDAPYVFFSAVNYAAQPPFTDKFKQGGRGIARPYRIDGSPGYTFMNPNSFQIISAGPDGDFGGGNGSYPSGDGYESGDKDNLTNFSVSPLRNAIPR